MLFALTLVSALLGSPEPVAPEPVGHAPARAEPTGAATPVIESLCLRLALPRGEGEALRCAGLPGFDLYLKGEAAARRVALGRPEGFTPAPPEPMTLGSAARWRMLGPRPVAAILRFALPAAPDEVLLAVVKAPGETSPGCLVAVLAGPAGSASSEAADALADREAAAFRCGVDRPTFSGKRASPAAQRAGLAWVASPSNEKP